MNRIDGLNTLGTSRTQGMSSTSAPDAAARNRQSGAAGEAEGPQDHVTVSFRSRIMADASRAVQSSNDVRADKVAMLKAAIANGTYKPDATDIAARLLRSISA